MRVSLHEMVFRFVMPFYVFLLGSATRTIRSSDDVLFIAHVHPESMSSALIGGKEQRTASPGQPSPSFARFRFALTVVP